jgi:hypothetical protein
MSEKLMQAKISKICEEKKRAFKLFPPQISSN